METISSKSGSFRSKLKEIGEIEEKNSFLGVRLRLNDNARSAPLTSEEVVDYVREILDDTIALSKVKHSLRVVDEYPPS